MSQILHPQSISRKCAQQFACNDMQNAMQIVLAKNSKHSRKRSHTVTSRKAGNRKMKQTMWNYRMRKYRCSKRDMTKNHNTNSCRGLFVRKSMLLWYPQDFPSNLIICENCERVCHTKINQTVSTDFCRFGFQSVQFWDGSVFSVFSGSVQFFCNPGTHVYSDGMQL